MGDLYDVKYVTVCFFLHYMNYIYTVYMGRCAIVVEVFIICLYEMEGK